MDPNDVAYIRITFWGLNWAKREFQMNVNFFTTTRFFMLCMRKSKKVNEVFYI